MKITKKYVAVALLACCLFVVPSANAFLGFGDIVFDPSVMMQTVLNGIEEIGKWVEQIEAMEKQYEQLQQSYDAVTGARGLGDILDSPALKSYLPDDWRGVYDKIKDGGYTGLTGSARSIRDANRAYEICSNIKNDAAKKACEREVAQAAQDKAFQSEAYDKTKDRLKQIEKLMKQVSNTQDQKEALEALGRLSAEQAMIQNEMTRLQLYSMLVQSEEKLAAQQRKEIANKQMDKKGFTNLKPVQIELKNSTERE